MDRVPLQQRIVQIQHKSVSEYEAVILKRAMLNDIDFDTLYQKLNAVAPQLNEVDHLCLFHKDIWTSLPE
jgi:hypothetical protein